MANRMSKVFKTKSKEFGSLSGNFDPRSLTNSHFLGRYGLLGDVLLASYEQAQSLLAVATTKGIYVLGQNGVEVFYKIAAGHHAVHMQIHKSHLVAIDDKQTLYTWDLEQNVKEPVVTQALRGVVTTIYAEPSLDWLFLGMKDGTVLAWDLIAERLSATFKVKNQYFDRQEDWRLMGESYATPRYHISPVVQLSIHPTDLGMLLITYADGACLFSFKENMAKTFYECIIPGDGNVPERKPALTCSSFSPDGSFVVIGCIDGTFAFFNAKEGETPLQVRTLDMSDINLPHNDHVAAMRYDPIVDVKWCCKADPSETFLLVAGGLPNDLKGISLLDYGKTSTRAAELPEYFATPQRQKILPLSRESVLSMTPIGTASPYYLSHDPQCLLVINAAGDILPLDMPDGRTTRSEVLPAALTMTFPTVTSYTTSTLSRSLLTALLARHQSLLQSSSLLVGGSSRTRRATEEHAGAVLCTIHHGTTLRMFHTAAGHVLDPPLLEIDLSLTMPNTFADMVTMSDTTGELAIASESGLVVLFRTTMPTSLDDDFAQDLSDLSLVDPMPTPVGEAQDMLFKFSKAQSAASPANPFCVISARKGGVTALCVSDVGFVAIGYESGYFILVDLRGPAIFYASSCDRLEMRRKESVFRKSTTPKLPQNAAEYVTTISIMSLSVDARVSLAVVVGTNCGRAITFELLKESNGVFTALLTNITNVSGTSPIRAILGCNQYGESLVASGAHLSNMHMDVDVADCLIFVTDREIVSYMGLGEKADGSSLRTAGPVTSAQLIMLPETDSVFVGVAFKSGTIEFFSIPDMQPLRAISLSGSHGLDRPRLLSNGDVIFMEGESALSLFNLVGRGLRDSDQPMAALFDALKQPTIPRPTISNWAWVTGTQYVRASDLDLLISGGDRPLSKRAAEKLAAEEKQRALIERQTASRDKVANRVIQQNAGGNDRGSGRNTYGRMQMYGQERGERVNHVNDLYENVSKASGEWLTEMDKLASNAKKSAGKAALRSLLGL